MSNIKLINHVIRNCRYHHGSCYKTLTSSDLLSLSAHRFFFFFGFTSFFLSGGFWDHVFDPVNIHSQDVPTTSYKAFNCLNFTFSMESFFPIAQYADTHTV